MKIDFSAFEYQLDGSLRKADYSYQGDEASGWDISRNGEQTLHLGKGYQALQSVYCGVCSTDLARKFLPFPLPQIIGHEVIAKDLKNGNYYAIEINDSCHARGDAEEIFCKSGIHTHCPDRKVLGIDRLPGGFAPFFLAPVNSMIDVSGISLKSAVMIEPFAAALHAVLSSTPKPGQRVAVLGPRKLGMLILAALNAHRKAMGVNFSIHAIIRNEVHRKLCREMGADEVHVSGTLPKDSKSFDLVYDTTGKPEGLEMALELATSEVHIKSTSGQPFYGIHKITELVVDELSILPYSKENLDFSWPGSKYNPTQIYSTPSSKTAVRDGQTLHQMPVAGATEFLRKNGLKTRLPRFDLGVIQTIDELDSLIRPEAQNENSLIRPRGAILYAGNEDHHPLGKFLASGKSIRTSRCGDFKIAMDVLRHNPELCMQLEKMITHIFPSTQIPEAFSAAQGHDSVKVLVEY